MKWRLIRPRTWEPLGHESVVYRPPDGDVIRGATHLCATRDGDNHIIFAGRHRILADRRDIFPMPGWKRERAAIEQERAEGERDEEERRRDEEAWRRGEGEFEV